MSTLAAWLFVAVGVAFVAAVLLVVMAMRWTYRRGRALAGELGLLLVDLDRAVGSGSARDDSRPSA